MLSERYVLHTVKRFLKSHLFLSPSRKHRKHRKHRGVKQEWGEKEKIPPFNFKQSWKIGFGVYDTFGLYIRGFLCLIFVTVLLSVAGSSVGTSCDHCTLRQAGYFFGRGMWQVQVVVTVPRSFSNYGTCCCECTTLCSGLAFSGENSDQHVHVQWQQQQKTVKRNPVGLNKPLFPQCRLVKHLPKYIIFY